ncbi:MAG: mandelate racemase/muconate lactonizing enzyme family protein [Hyphomicrobiales bacterium]|nr:mandelate racemase/muconate lactonizing enzyme family protein [Hyphomicrobiales bacterium]
MKIKAVDVFGYELTYAHGEYVMSKGRAAQAQSSTLVRLRTDDGIEGWGETSTLGGTYLPSFTGGVRAALRDLAKVILGLDPRNISAIHRAMDALLLGQSAAKSAIDVACWDIFGKSVGLPVATLLGGVMQEEFPLYEAVPLAAPEQMADFVAKRGAAGISRFQVKVGNDPYEDARRTRSVVEVAGPNAVIVADSNGGWGLQSGIIAVREMAGLDIYIEQPCRETADCAIVQSMSTLPLVLDESICNAADLYKAKYEAKAGTINIKLSRLGGIAGAARMRDQAHELGMTVCIEDVWGGDVTTAAVAHLAASTAPETLMHASFFNEWTKEHVAGHFPRAVGGRGSAPTGPGLGIDVDIAGLGAPLFAAL